MINSIASWLSSLEKLYNIFEKKKFITHTFRILVLLTLLFGGYYIWNNFFNDANKKGKTEVEIIESEVKFWGELVLGTKISIRDRIKHIKPYQLDIDPEGKLNHCIKKGSRTYFSEIGYSQKDVITSKVIDTIKGEETLGRTLQVELPLPDTLVFELTDTFEVDKSPIYGCWIESSAYINERERIIKTIDQQAYNDILTKYLVENFTTAFTEAAMTMYKYINGAYEIGRDTGFDAIISVFDFELNNQSYHIEIKCSTSETGTLQHEILKNTGQLVKK